MSVNASAWYGARITLPRAGGQWRTVSRKSTSKVQGLKASGNAYQIVGNIENAGNKTIGSWQTFNAHNTIAKYVATYSAGSSIKAAFQTNSYNYLTTTAYLSWRP
ncbi:hypothetical protein [Lactobacillus sp. UCMA15818]|uniref:hypothetical protein n=1 Tax=Lactobacillus sp. UCMA15818 TaxID=2583394 RepID=UPI0025AF624B|nr:hypothetical protein [Lactobacillus sp. UCMA15818]MDN2452798.1 hypothetical protein [Lactobacillus sp. UCMA15818]